MRLFGSVTREEYKALRGQITTGSLYHVAKFESLTDATAKPMLVRRAVNPNAG